MYVRSYTTQRQIRAEIERIEQELNANRHLTTEDRQALHDELDYLYSFVQEGMA